MVKFTLCILYHNLKKSLKSEKKNKKQVTSEQPTVNEEPRGTRLVWYHLTQIADLSPLCPGVRSSQTPFTFVWGGVRHMEVYPQG